MAARMRWWRTFWYEYVLLNWRYKLAALAAATIIWTYIAGQQTMQAVLTVPIFFQNLPEGAVILNQQLPKIQVTVSGRRDRLLAVKERQIWVSIDLSQMRIGKNPYRLSKKDIMAPAGIEINIINPMQIVIPLRPAPPGSAQ